MEKVILYVVKGNLKHRIHKLGTEIALEGLAPNQVALRNIALQQEWHCWPPERPSWANGAFLYLTRNHAQQIQGVVERQGIHLQSKHILVSEENVAVLQSCLGAKPE